MTQAECVEARNRAEILSRLFPRDAGWKRQISAFAMLEQAARIIEGYHDSTCLDCSDVEEDSKTHDRVLKAEPCAVAEWLQEWHREGEDEDS